MNRLRKLGVGLLLPLAIGLAILSLLLWGLGYDPVAGLRALWSGAFGSWYALTSATLVRATPLIILGLGFALAFRGGALNIGMEGQFLAGAIAATWVGVRVDAWHPLLAVPAVWIAGILAGVLWVLVPVLLKVRLGVLEVITTLLLNFVAEAVVSYMVQGPLQEASRVYPQSDPIALAAQLPLLGGTRLHLGFVVGLVLAGAGAVIFARSVWGFRLKAVGAGPRAAWMIGRIPSAKLLAAALLISGAFAGLGGAIEVGGVTHALFQNLSPGYGFTAIAVALLARGNPMGIVGTGLLFGALEAGASAMQRDAGIPSVAVSIVQATVIIVILLSDVAARRRQALTGAPEVVEVE